MNYAIYFKWMMYQFLGCQFTILFISLTLHHENKDAKKE